MNENETGPPLRTYKGLLRVTELNPTTIALDAIDPPTERLPDPEWIFVTDEEMKKMFSYYSIYRKKE